jgi:hypothetical protein
MEKDKLISVIEEIQKWCETNDIICFIGSTQDEPYIIYSYEKESNNDWNKFLQIAKKLNVNIVVLEKEINLLKTLYDFVFEQIIEDVELDSRMKERYQNALAHDGEIAMIKLTFHYNDICYKFSVISDWYIDFHFASKEVEEPSDNETEEDNSENRTFSAVNPQNETISKRLSEQEIEEFARKAIENNEFIKSKSRIQKQEIIKKMLKDSLGDEYSESSYHYWNVIRRAEKIFEMEVRPKLESEIKQKVLELKAQGLKKVEIRSKLDISQGMVDRFYHMD